MSGTGTLSRRWLLGGAGLAAAAGLAPAGALARPALAAGNRGLNALARGFGGRLILPGDPAYPMAALPNNARWSGVLPVAVALCADAADVQRCIAWVQDNRVPFAVRSGGHSYAGFSTTRGLLVDVRAMNGVTLDLKDGTATVQGGANNQDVAAALRATSFGIPSGRCPTVGASGLVLGGGWGFSATHSGLTCDSLLATDLVLADGTRRSVGDRDDADLFWAARGGGGGNFGVHTSFTFKLRDVGDITTFNLVWPPGRQVELLEALQAIQQANPRSLSTRTKARPLAAGPHPGRDGIIVETLGVHWGSERDLREIMAPAYAIARPRSERIYEQEYWRARDYLLTDDPNGLYEIRCNYVEHQLGGEALETMLGWMTRWPGGSLRQDNMGILFAMGGAVNDVAPDATAYPHRSSNYIFEMEANWGPMDSAEAVKAQRDWLRSYHQDMQRFVQPRSYVNFPNRELADWGHAYYAGNLPRLSQVKSRWDPGNLFQFAQSIPLAKLPAQPLPRLAARP